MPATESAFDRRIGRRAAWIAALSGLAVAAIAAAAQVAARFDTAVFDRQVQIVRAAGVASPPAAAQVALVGIDQATYAAIAEPFALMHRSLGAALEGIAAGGARLVALDIVLADRSYDALVPGLDAALIRGLVRAREAGGVLFVLEPDSAGRMRPPLESFISAAGHRDDAPALVTAMFPPDHDGVVRRYDPRLSAPGLPTLAAAVAQRLGRGDRVRAGWIDYVHGAPFSYVPLIDVLRWQREGDVARLRQAFGNRVVLVGSVVPYVDRVAQPVRLVGWEYPDTAPPGVVVHAQAVRSLLGAGLVAPAPWPLAAALVIAFAALAAVPQVTKRWAYFAGAVAVTFFGGAVLHAYGTFVAPGAAWIAGFVAAGLRTAFDVNAARASRARLARTFGGYVSPQLLRAILSGEVAAGHGRGRLAFMFADLRGFTSWSERTDPGEVLAVLNRYYATVTPLIHRHGGTIDNFRGDGIMVMFGAPAPLDDPCSAAFAAAREMVDALQRLNATELAAHGVALEVGVGIAYGDAVFGDLGSDDRKDFTALGDAVNVAARLQDLSKTLGYPVLLTMDAVERIAEKHGLVPLGEAPLKGHSPVAIAGWRPAPAGTGAEGAGATAASGAAAAAASATGVAAATSNAASRA